MRNIFLLRTDRPSFLFKDIKDNLMFNKDWIEIPIGRVNQNIYITSNEEIKDWEYGYNPYYKEVVKCVKSNISIEKGWYKIILTTDPDLIKYGIQAIDDEFLGWFVKNPSCEKVEIKSDWEFLGDDYRHGGSQTMVYKIIIPQEPKQELNFYEKLKEYFENTPREKVLADWNKSAEFDKVGPTIDNFIENSNKERLKEASKKWSLNSAKEFALSYFKKSDEVSSKGMFTYELLLRILEAGIECGYKFGAKRQDEKMYTYDELRQIAYNAYCLGQLEEPTENKYNLWIQQFKKK